MDHAAPKPPRAAPAPAVAARRIVPYLLGVLGLVGTLSGCSMWHQARRTLYLEPPAWALDPDNAAAFRKYRQAAEQALAELVATDPEAIPSSFYEEGFVDGFTDSMFAGEDGRPAPLPPRHLVRLQLRDPMGRQAIADWIAGFRHGSRIAATADDRRSTVLPSEVRRRAHPNGDSDDPTDSIWEPLRESSLELSPPPGPAAMPSQEPTPADPLPPRPKSQQPSALDSPVPPANLLPPFEPSMAAPPPARNPALDQLPALDELPTLDNLPPFEGTAPAGQPDPPEQSLFPDTAVEPSGGLQLNGPTRRVSHARQPAIETSVAPATYFEPTTDAAAQPIEADPFSQLETTTHESALTLSVAPESTATSASATSDQPQPPAELRLLDAITVSPLPVPSYPDNANVSRWERLFVAGDHPQENGPSGDARREAAAATLDFTGHGNWDATQPQTVSPTVKDGPLLQPATGDATSADTGTALMITSPIASASAANWQPARSSWQPVDGPSTSNPSKQRPRKAAGTIIDLGKQHAAEKTAGKDADDEKTPTPQDVDDPFLNPFGDK